jgi:hypothetical protein
MAINQQATTTITLNNEQAKRELDELQKRMSRLIELKKKTEAEGDITAYKKVSTELNKAQKEANAYQRQVSSVAAVLEEMSGATLKQLKDALQSVNSQLLNTKRGTAEFTALKDAQKELQSEIDSSTGRLKLQQTPLQQLVSIAKGLLPAFGWTAITAGAVSAFRSIKDSTDTLGTQWDVFIGGLKGATNEFWRTIATGDWSDFLKNLNEAVRVGREYVSVMDDIEEKSRALSIAEADSKRIALELEEKVRNATLTKTARVSAAEERIRLEESLAEKRAKVARDQYEAELMLTMQQTRLSKEKLIEVVSDLDSETKLKAKAYNQQLSELESFQKAQRAISRSGGGAVLHDSERIKQIKLSIAGATETVRLYAEALKGTGKTTDEQLNRLVDSYGKMIDAENSSLENTRRIRTQMNSLLASETKKGRDIEKNALDEALKALDLAYQERLLKIEQHAINEKKSQEWLNIEKSLAERAYLEQKLALLEEAGKSGVEIQRKLIEREIELIKQADDEIKRIRENNISEFESWLIEKLRLEDDALSKSVAANIAFGNEVEKEQKEQVRRERESMATRANAIMDFTENVGSSFQEFLTDQNSSFGSFLKDILIQTLSFVEKMLIAAIAQETIKSIMAGAPLNPFAVAKAAAKIILLKAAFGVAKAAISGGEEKDSYKTGGFTGSGSSNEPAGIVHKNEWVAPERLVKSPVTGPIISILESIRKKNIQIRSESIRNIPIRGYSSGGLVTDVSKLRDSAKSDLLGSIMGMYSVADKKQNEILEKLAIAVDDLMKWKPKVYTEDIRKSLDRLNNIDKNRGL